jgi:hypothetical protein
MNYLIRCRVLDAEGQEVFSGTVRAKNKKSELYARIGLQDFIFAKWPDAASVHITGCKEWNNIMDVFNDIFKMTPYE